MREPRDLTEGGAPREGGEVVPQRPQRQASATGAVAATLNGGAPTSEASRTPSLSVRRHLYSATVRVDRPGAVLLAFHASLAGDYREVFERVLDRFGPELAGHAVVRTGFDAGHPLVPDGVAALLLGALGGGGALDLSLDVTFVRGIVR